MGVPATSLGPLDILHFERMPIMGVCHVVTKLVCLLPFDGAHIATTEDHLPNGPSAALRHDMILCAQQQVGTEWKIPSSPGVGRRG